MKIETAISVLRAARARMEVWGVLQLGPTEVFALAFVAKHAPEDAETLKTNIKSISSLAFTGILRVTPALFDTFRVGYKLLETLPKTLEFSTDEAEEILESATTEPNPDWMKAMGISDKDIEGAIGDDTEPKG